MAKILQAGETGFGILIEQDAGYISPDMNKNIISEDFKVKPNQPLLINCVLQKWGVENKNGRIYPKEILVPQVNEYEKIVNNNSAGSEADHPDSSIISLHNLSHMITKMWWGSGNQEHILFGQIKLLVTRGYIEYGICSVIGDKILLYLENGYKLGISSRGVGSLKEIDGKNFVQSDFELIGFDLVATPSTPGAYLFPGVENVEQAVGENYEKKDGIYIKENNDRIDHTLDRFLL
jgi:hypothetical protein